MGKFIKSTISNFLNENINNKDFLYKRIEWVLKMYKKLDKNEYSEIEDNLYNFTNNDFPIGLNNIPNEIKLYRVLVINSKNDLDKNILGKHFIAHKDLINDDFLWSIGITKKDYKNLYIVTIITQSEYIDIDWTLNYKARYPNEFEFTLKDNYIFEIENVEKYTN